jgi:hypothetical protein
MRFAARLARLERLASADSCPQCRLFERHSLRDHSKARDTTRLVMHPCDLCGRRERLDLSCYPAICRKCFGFTRRPHWRSRLPTGWFGSHDRGLSIGLAPGG